MATLDSGVSGINFFDILPTLDGDSHKGQHGKVAVVGGCADYTGAPYYAAMSAMKVGADGASVFCTKSAATAIKSYSPELIVRPCVLETADVSDTWEDVELPEELTQRAVRHSVNHMERWLEKSTSVVLGMGLGDDPITLAIASRVIEIAIAKGLPLVVDADGIALICKNPGLVRGYHRAVLTPNVPELWRLADALGIEHGKVSPWESPDLAYEVSSRLAGPVLVAKGQQDLVWTFMGSDSVCFSPPGLLGCPKRCGGQGDILSGVLGTTLSWAASYSKQQRFNVATEKAALTEATVQALQIMRAAAFAAYQEKRRSVVASDIIAKLPSIVQEHWPDGSDIPMMS